MQSKKTKKGFVIIETLVAMLDFSSKNRRSPASSRVSRMPLRNATAGFVIIETLVAISLILFVIPAALTVASKNIALGGYARDQMTATYLAEEAIEIMRNRRDTNTLRNIFCTPTPACMVSWTSGWATNAEQGMGGGNCTTGNACLVEINASGGTAAMNISPCIGGPQCTLPSGSNFQLAVDVNGQYRHSGIGTTPTIYYRFVRTSLVSADEYSVTATVTYSSRFVTKSIVLVNHFLNWYQ